MKVSCSSCLLLLLLVLGSSLWAASSSLAAATISNKNQSFQPTIAFVHRHGARTPQGIVDEIATCAYPLCQLTKAGLAMCNSVGNYTMKTFIEPLTGISSYDVKTYQSISTDTRRTVLSAESVLAGAFGNEVAPFVDFIPTSLDYNMSFWASWPYYFISHARETRLAGFPAEYIGEHFSKAVIQEFGEAMGARQICNISPVDCLVLAADILECNASNGDPVANVLKEHSAEIVKTKVVMFSKLLGYDPAEPHCTEPGSWAYSFALQLAETLNYSLGPVSNDNEALDADRWPTRVFHFAAHDWTLFPLYSAFGFWEPHMMYDTAWIPRFSDTLLLHTVPPKDPSHNYTNPGVKAYRYFPRQTAAAGDPVDMPSSFPVEQHDEVGLRCSDALGNLLRFSNESAYGCSVQEIINTIQRVRPRSELGGICYATPESMDKTGCLSDEAPRPGSACQRYRAVCDHLPCAVPPNETNSTKYRCPVTGKFFKIADPARGFACTNVRPGWEVGVNSRVDEKTGELVVVDVVPDNDEQQGDSSLSSSAYPIDYAVGLVIGGVSVGVFLGFFSVKWLFGERNQV